LNFSFSLKYTPTDEILVYVNLKLSSSKGFSDDIVIPLVLTGNRAGERLTFENDVEGFTHESLAFRQPDMWHLSTERNKTIGGRFAWKCGSDILSEKYSANMDNVLLSPPIAVEPNDIIQFDSWIDATLYNEIGDSTVQSRWALDGGFLEISVNNGEWELLNIPGAQYYFANDKNRFPEYFPEYEEFTCISGHDRTWRTIRIGLGNIRGLLRVRWRFVAMFFASYVPKYEGWYVDNIYFGENKVNSLEPGNTWDLANNVWFQSPARPPIAFNTTEYPIKIYSLSGKLIAELRDSNVWNGFDKYGNFMPQGMYIIQASENKIGKLILIH
jgi:hypothetical protein